MKTSPTAPLALLCLGLASLPAAASDPWDAPFNIVVGGFNASATTTARLDSDFGGSGTEVSFENALGIDKSKTLPTVDFFWRFNARHGLEASWISLKRDGSRTISGTIDWGEVVFPVNTSVHSTFDSDTIRVAYRYSPIHENGNELALLLGAHYTRLKASISSTGGTLSDEASADFPLPTIGVRGAWKFAPNWRLSGYGQALKVKIDQYDGGLYNAAAAVEWAFMPQAYAGLGYNYYKYTLDSTKEHVRGKFDYRFEGPALYLAWAF